MLKYAANKDVVLLVVKLLLRKIDLDKELALDGKVIRDKLNTSSKILLNSQARFVKLTAENKKLEQKIRAMVSTVPDVSRTHSPGIENARPRNFSIVSGLANQPMTSHHHYGSSPVIKMQANKSSVFPEIKGSKAPLKVRNPSASMIDDKSESLIGQVLDRRRSFMSQNSLKKQTKTISMKSRSALESPKGRGKILGSLGFSGSIKNYSPRTSVHPGMATFGELSELDPALDENDLTLIDIDTHVAFSMLELQHLATSANILGEQSKLIVALMEAIEITEAVNRNIEIQESMQKSDHSPELLVRSTTKGSKLDICITRKSEELWRKHNVSDISIRKRVQSSNKYQFLRSITNKSIIDGISRSKFGEKLSSTGPNSLKLIPLSKSSQHLVMNCKLSSQNNRPQSYVNEGLPKLFIKKGTSVRNNSPQPADPIDSLEYYPMQVTINQARPLQNGQSALSLVTPEEKCTSQRSIATPKQASAKSVNELSSSRLAQTKPELPKIQIINEKEVSRPVTPQKLARESHEKRTTNYLSPNNSARKSDKPDKNPKLPPSRSGSGMIGVMMQLIDLSMMEIAEHRSIQHSRKNQLPNKPNHYLTKDDMTDPKTNPTGDPRDGGRRNSLQGATQDQPKSLVFLPMALKFLKNMGRLRNDLGNSSFQFSNSMDFDMESYMNISNLDDIENELLRAQTYYKQNSNNSMDDFWMDWTQQNRPGGNLNTSILNKTPIGTAKNKQVNFAFESPEAEGQIIDYQKDSNLEIHKGFDSRPLSTSNQIPISVEKQPIHKADQDFTAISKKASKDYEKLSLIREDNKLKLGNSHHQPEIELRNQPPRNIKVEYHKVDRRRSHIPILHSSPLIPDKVERKKDHSRTIHNSKKTLAKSHINLTVQPPIMIEEEPKVMIASELSADEDKFSPYLSSSPLQRKTNRDSKKNHKNEEKIATSIDGSPKNSDTIESPELKSIHQIGRIHQRRSSQGQLSQNSSYIKFIDENSNECISPASKFRTQIIKHEDDQVREVNLGTLEKRYDVGLGQDNATFDELIKFNRSKHSLASNNKSRENRSSTEKEMENPILYEKPIQDTVNLNKGKGSSPSIYQNVSNRIRMSNSEKTITYIESED